MPDPTAVPGVRPLTGLALGTAIALAAVAGHLLFLLLLSWRAYQVLAAYAESGVPNPGISRLLHDAGRIEILFVMGVVVSSGCALGCLAGWMLRARRNAAAHHPFRYSPAMAVAGVLAPVANLWLAGPVLAEIADAGRPPAVRPRPVLERAWWFCMLAAALGLAGASVAEQWTTLGTSGEEGPTVLPTLTEHSAQLVVTGFRAVAAVGFVIGAVLLVVTMVRIGRWQASTTRAAASRAVDEPSAAPRPAAVGVAVRCAAVTAAALAAMVLVPLVLIDLFGPAITGEDRLYFIYFGPAVLAFDLGQAVALGAAAVRFRRRPHRSTGLAVTACVVAWLRLLLGPPVTLSALGTPASVVNVAVAFGCVVTAVMVDRAFRPDR
jgi:hypothetical protein